MTIRENPVREKLARGEPSFGVMVFEFFTPGLAALMAEAGAEWLVFDTEHSGAGIETIKAQVSFARGLGLVPLVRVPGTTYPMIAGALDAGAWGVMVPMVETVEQARNIAAWARYRPDGVRGLAFGIAHDDYAGGASPEKLAAVNRRTLTIALIETVAGIENADAIMAVPGIDVGWLGHYDLTDSMGIPGQFEDPRFWAAAERLAQACRRHGKAAGVLDGNPDFLKRMIGLGYRALGCGTDTGLMLGAVRQGMAMLARLASGD